MELNIKKTRKDSMLLVALEGRLDAVTAQKLEDALRGELEGVTDLVFDFKQLAYITSAGLRALLTTYRVLRGKGKITVVNANEMVLEVLELTGFRAILSIE